MRDSFDVTTIIFAILAVFVVWKLRSVLGQRTGAERPPGEALRRDRTPGARPSEPANEDGKVVRLPGAARGEAPRPARDSDPDRWKPFVEAGSAVAAGLDAIAARDASFDLRGFVEGAKAAYEMIVVAFAAGDRKTLRPLLANDVYDSFAAAIAQREKDGHKVDTTFVSIDKAQVEDAQLRGATAQVTMRMQSKLITATRDRAGEVIDGSPDKVVDTVDVWTFARDVSSRDPNWRLIATEAGQ
ncbi:MAG: Tim44 domain-containing protein [Methylobacteriaceae bacterium]|nr:Tim44 domain-containing protein [Methylobacteriaceae bacterium]